MCALYKSTVVIIIIIIIFLSLLLYFPTLQRTLKLFHIVYLSKMSVIYRRFLHHRFGTGKYQNLYDNVIFYSYQVKLRGYLNSISCKILYDLIITESGIAIIEKILTAY